MGVSPGTRALKVNRGSNRLRGDYLRAGFAAGGDKSWDKDKEKDDELYQV